MKKQKKKKLLQEYDKKNFQHTKNLKSFQINFNPSEKIFKYKNNRMMTEQLGFFWGTYQ